MLSSVDDTIPWFIFHKASTNCAISKKYEKHLAMQESSILICYLGHKNILDIVIKRSEE